MSASAFVVVTSVPSEEDYSKYTTGGAASTGTERENDDGAPLPVNSHAGGHHGGGSSSRGSLCSSSGGGGAEGGTHEQQQQQRNSVQYHLGGTSTSHRSSVSNAGALGASSANNNLMVTPSLFSNPSQGGRSLNAFGASSRSTNGSGLVNPSFSVGWASEASFGGAGADRPSMAAAAAAVAATHILAAGAAAHAPNAGTNSNVRPPPPREGSLTSSTGPPSTASHGSLASQAAAAPAPVVGSSVAAFQPTAMMMPVFPPQHQPYTQQRRPSGEQQSTGGAFQHHQRLSSPQHQASAYGFDDTVDVDMLVGVGGGRSGMNAVNTAVAGGRGGGHPAVQPYGGFMGGGSSTVVWNGNISSGLDTSGTTNATIHGSVEDSGMVSVGGSGRSDDGSAATTPSRPPPHNNMGTSSSPSVAVPQRTPIRAFSPVDDEGDLSEKNGKENYEEEEEEAAAAGVGRSGVGPHPLTGQSSNSIPPHPSQSSHRFSTNRNTQAMHHQTGNNNNSSGGPVASRNGLFANEGNSSVNGNANREFCAVGGRTPMDGMPEIMATDSQTSFSGAHNGGGPALFSTTSISMFGASTSHSSHPTHSTSSTTTPTIVGSSAGSSSTNTNPNGNPNSSHRREEKRAPFSWKNRRLLGKGGFGSVYLGMETHSGQLLAAKKISLRKCTDTEKRLETIAALKNEILLMKRIQHPNIVRYIRSHFEASTDSFFIFMEFVPGGSLRQCLDEFGPLPTQLAARHVRCIMDGLKYLHQNRVLHRDVKAANVLLTTEGVVKLADFGSAQYLNGIEGFHGTLNWMAPEVMRNDTARIGEKADVWSLGCTLIELLTAAFPFAYSTPVDLYALLQAGAAASPLQAPPEVVDPHARDFIARCLRRDPAIRPSILELESHPFLTTPSDTVSGIHSITDSISSSVFDVQRNPLIGGRVGSVFSSVSSAFPLAASSSVMSTTSGGDEEEYARRSRALLRQNLRSAAGLRQPYHLRPPSSVHRPPTHQLVHNPHNQTAHSSSSSSGGFQTAYSSVGAFGASAAATFDGAGGSAQTPHFSPTHQHQQYPGGGGGGPTPNRPHVPSSGARLVGPPAPVVRASQPPNRIGSRRIEDERDGAAFENPEQLLAADILGVAYAESMVTGPPPPPPSQRPPPHQSPTASTAAGGPLKRLSVTSSMAGGGGASFPPMPSTASTNTTEAEGDLLDDTETEAELVRHIAQQLAQDSPRVSDLENDDDDGGDGQGGAGRRGSQQSGRDGELDDPDGPGPMDETITISAQQEALEAAQYRRLLAGLHQQHPSAQNPFFAPNTLLGGAGAGVLAVGGMDLDGSDNAGDASGIGGLALGHSSSAPSFRHIRRVQLRRDEDGGGSMADGQSDMSDSSATFPLPEVFCTGRRKLHALIAALIALFVLGVVVAVSITLLR